MSQIIKHLRYQLKYAHNSHKFAKTELNYLKAIKKTDRDYLEKWTIDCDIIDAEKHVIYTKYQVNVAKHNLISAKKII